MTVAQVRRAVIEPARLAKVAVEDGLVGLLLAHLSPRGAGERTANGGEPGAPDGSGAPGGAYERGALPLLSHAMLAIWGTQPGSTMTIADYLASGGIRDALTQTAERAYGSLTPDQQRLARRLFLHLVHVADDLPPSRTTVELGELRGWGDDAEAVLATSGYHDASDANECVIMSGDRFACGSIPDDPAILRSRCRGPEHVGSPKAGVSGSRHSAAR